jgi:HEAT repeat protein
LTRSESFGRNIICLQACAVALGYALAVYLMYAFYVHRWVADSGLAFGYAFCLVEGCVISILLLLSLAIKFVRRRRDASWTRLQPVIVGKASAHLSGADSVEELRALRRRHPREVEQCMLELLMRVRGTASVRLTALIVDLGLAEFWKRQYRSRIAVKRRDAINHLGRLGAEAGLDTLVLALSDSNDEVKLEASRALISTGGVAELAAVFRTSLRESLLVRAILTEALRPYAPLLCEAAVPDALSSGNAKTVRIALDIVRAWRKSLPLARVQPLLRHPDSAVRAAALAIVPQLVSPTEFEPELLECLSDEAEAVRSAAADAAGTLRLLSALPGLKACLEQGGAEATIAAAYALARIGGQGWHILEQQVLNSRSRAASAALEALEQARSERLLPGAV